MIECLLTCPSGHVTLTSSTYQTVQLSIKTRLRFFYAACWRKVMRDDGRLMLMAPDHYQLLGVAVAALEFLARDFLDGEWGRPW